MWVESMLNGPRLKSDSYFMGKIETLGAKKEQCLYHASHLFMVWFANSLKINSQMGSTSAEKKIKVTIYSTYNMSSLKVARCMVQTRHGWIHR